MHEQIELQIRTQPDDISCGPTCLHAIYRYYGDSIPLEEVIDETGSLEDGGTLAVVLANHALRRGYRAKIFSFNVQVFDPTWMHLTPEQISEKLLQQSQAKSDPKLQFACKAYREFLHLGGILHFHELDSNLIRHYLKKSVPILTGLSSTYLYESRREIPDTNQEDDVVGEPAGHFVVLSGYDKESKKVSIADPHATNPLAVSKYYQVSIARLINSILLGIWTYDANLLVIQPAAVKI